MRKLTFSLVVALLCGTATVEVSAQQGPGQSVGLTSNTHANLGLSSRATLAHGQGALRSIGRGAASGGTSIGAQLNASGSVKVSRSGRGGETQSPGKHRGLSLRARARSEMHARVGVRKGQNPNAGTSPSPTPEPNPEPGSTPPNDAGGRAPWERAGCSRADWHLAQRLAVIDRQRDIALQNGNEVLLQKADKLEAHVRLQYEQRTGVFAEKPSSEGTNPPPAEGSPTTPSETTPPASESPSSTEQPTPPAN